MSSNPAGVMQRPINWQAFSQATSSMPPQAKQQVPPFEVYTHPSESGSTNHIEIQHVRTLASMGLRQKIVEAWNPETGDFDLNVFLTYPSQHVPHSFKANQYLAADRQNTVDIYKLIDRLPERTKEIFQKRLYESGNTQYRKEVEAMRKLFGLDQTQSFTQEQIDRFYETYGGRQGNIFRLIADLQARQIDEKTIFNLASLVQGELQTRITIGYLNLRETGFNPDYKKVDVLVKNFCKEPHGLDDSERAMIRGTRAALHLPEPVPPKKAQPIQPVRPDRPPQPKPPEKMSKFGTDGKTDTGRVREVNEDNYYLSQDGNTFAVFDGMGGHAAGATASSLARQRFSQGGTDIVTMVQEANRQIYNAGAADKRYKDMGTTVTAGMIDNYLLYLANVGDSRAYLIRNERIKQLTHDHSWVQSEIDAGVLTAEDARIHPRRNVITRSLGRDPDVNVDTFRESLQTGDRIVLSTDGLHGYVTDTEIAAIVTEAPSAAAATQRLIDLANERGGPDNITVIVRGV